MMRFLTDELQDAEDAGDRGTWMVSQDIVHPDGSSVWIIGHVPSGWDGSNPLLNPTNLCTSALLGSQL